MTSDSTSTTHAYNKYPVVISYQKYNGSVVDYLPQCKYIKWTLRSNVIQFLQECLFLEKNLPMSGFYTHTKCLARRVSFETSFDSKQPKLEPKLVSLLSETKRLFRLFRFYTETENFDVSIEPKQTEDQLKQFDREHIWVSENFGLLRFVSKQFCLFQLFW